LAGEKKYSAPALEKGLDILELLSEQEIGLTQVEIARSLDRTVGEIFRMLVVLQNRGFGFVLEDGHPNRIAPKKRPMHTIIPGMAVKDGQAVMPFGVMGGHFQPVGHTWLISSMLDHGLDPQGALDLARVFAYEGETEIENGIDDATASALAAKGHKINRIKSPHGGGQAIWIDREKGTLTGGSDPRKDGFAAGY